MWFRNLKEKYHSVNLGVDKRIIVKWIVKTENGKVWTVYWVISFLRLISQSVN
jgi:hypothetical protein